MLALTCDCGQPATVFFTDGAIACNNHNRTYLTSKDFPAPQSNLGEEMLYDHLDRYLGLFARL